MFSILALVSTIWLSNFQEQTPSALEQDPSGWTDLLAGLDSTLNGWTRVPIPPTAQLQEDSQWSIDPERGYLICSGDKGHEWIRWDEKVSDAIFHVEWRFTPVDRENPRYNSGVFVRNSADGRIWHQAQVGDVSSGFLFGDTPVSGELRRINFRSDVTEQRVLPAGQWNTFEIVCDGPKVTLWVNGDITNTWTDCQTPLGYVGLEAEGYRIEFRKVLLKPL